MFAKPRLMKSSLPLPNKKRKFGVEEVSFDNDARQEFLTGFHKRKQHRIKQAQDEAAKKARQERLETRKQLREERKREVEEHVESINKLLRESSAIENEDFVQKSEGESDEEWDGCPNQAHIDIDQEEEYIDEDRYTTITVESVSVSKDGLEKPHVSKEERGKHDADTKENNANEATTRPISKARPKKKKFHYESKFERQLTGRKQKAKKNSRVPR